MKTIFAIILLIQTSLLFAQSQFSCAANCGYAESYHEVTAQAETLSKAYNKLISSCTTAPLFIQAKARRNGDFDYTLASLQNACVAQTGVECSCSANCGSAAGYQEMVAKSSSSAKAYASLASRCQRGILFTQAVQNDRYDFDYTFATLSNACACY